MVSDELIFGLTILLDSEFCTLINIFVRRISSDTARVLLSTSLTLCAEKKKEKNNVNGGELNCCRNHNSETESVSSA